MNQIIFPRERMSLTVQLPSDYQISFPMNVLTPDTLLGNLVEQGYDTVNITQPFITPEILQLLHGILTQKHINQNLVFSIAQQEQLSYLNETGKYLGYPILSLIADPKYVELIRQHPEINILDADQLSQFSIYRTTLAFAIIHYFDALLQYVLERTLGHEVDAKLLGLAVLFNNRFAVQSFLQTYRAVNPLSTFLSQDEMTNFGVTLTDQLKLILHTHKYDQHIQGYIFKYAVMASPEILGDLITSAFTTLDSDHKSEYLRLLTQSAMQPEFNRQDLLWWIYDPKNNLPLPGRLGGWFDIVSDNAQYLDRNLLDLMIDRTMSAHYDEAIDEILQGNDKLSPTTLYIIDRFSRADPSTFTQEADPDIVEYVRKLQALITKICANDTTEIAEQFDDLTMYMDFSEPDPDDPPSIHQYPMQNYHILRSLTTNPDIFAKLDRVKDTWGDIGNEKEEEEDED